MPVTLAQASLNAAADIDRNIIDEFRKSSFLLDRLPFDQSVNPAGGGSTLVYGYTRQVSQRAAAFRAINPGATLDDVPSSPVLEVSPSDTNRICTARPSMAIRASVPPQPSTSSSG